MAIQFETEIDPTELLCDFLNLDIPDDVPADLNEFDYYKEVRKIYGSFKKKYPSIQDPEIVDSDDNENSSYHKLKSMAMIKRDTEYMLSETKSGRDSFTKEGEFFRYFDYHVHYDQKKKCLMLSRSSNLQQMIGLALINIKSTKNRIEQCPECFKWYIVPGKYPSVGCEDCRASVSRERYDEKVKNNPILKTYRMLNSRYSKRKSIDLITLDLWRSKATNIRNEYLLKYEKGPSEKTVQEFQQEIDLDRMDFDE